MFCGTRWAVKVVERRRGRNGVRSKEREGGWRECVCGAEGSKAEWSEEKKKLLRSSWNCSSIHLSREI
ncbi:MAG: hypothetical protein ACKERG_01175 [Candidatus Hodgkinia cicadicola]